MSVTTKLRHLIPPYFLLVSICLISSFNPAYAESHTPRTVKAIGTLTAIANKNYIDVDVTTDQIMVAILATNPKAFRGGNINFMIRNADLRLPSVDAIKRIPRKDATNLFKQHYSLFKRGRTGNLPPPAFISLSSYEQVETLIKEKAEQSEKLNTLEEERERLREMVERLEEEKFKRDDDLRTLEDRIQSLQSSSDSLGSARADLKLKLENGELTGEGAKLLEELDARNRSLNAQLQSARSEMAESTRMEITLERRMTDVQEENSQLAQALKEKGISPNNVIKRPDLSSYAGKTATEPSGSSSTNTDSINPEPSSASESSSTATAIVNNATMSEISQTEQGGWFDQYLGFIPKDLRWLIWLLPLFLILGLVWLIWKLISGGKSKTTRRVQQPVTTAAFVDHTQAIDPQLELEQEPQLEVSIKMDVARAYIEAGDYHAAREMLGEVISEGNTSQQQEANQLFDQISGL